MPTNRSVAIVTGGGAGIGKATSLRFVKEGYAVVIADYSEQDGAATARQIQQQGGEALFVQTDVAREADCHAAARAALERWGRIDALVANAGARVYGSILDASERDWEKILGVNLKGVVYSCKAALPAMVEQKRGAIVIVSSANALVGRADMPLYDATKAGVLSLTRSLAVAHGKDGIRVNAICPGYTVTDFHERNAQQRGVTPEQLRATAAGSTLLGRPAEPSEIASAIWFFASGDSAHVTGQHLMVDGGKSVGR